MWTDDEIQQALCLLTKKSGKYPSSSDLRKMGRSDLDNVIARHPLKHNGWRERMGGKARQGHRSLVRKAWSQQDIQQALKEESAIFGRMPTNSELASKGRSDLANIIAKRGGFRFWAEKMGLSLKECETHLAYDKEMFVKHKLEGLGHSAEETSAKCGYDLLVDGSKHIEVKYAKHTKSAGGFVFNFGYDVKSRKIDFAVLLCMEEATSKAEGVQTEASAVYVLPSSFLVNQTITITGTPRWKPYLNAWHLLKEA